MDERDLEDDLKLDRFNLVREAETLADTYRYWTMESANARRDADAAKDKLELTEAEVALEIRSSAEKKPTEAMIESMVTADTRVVRAKREFIEAKHRQALLEGAVRAMDHKRSQLDNLTRLWIAGYYADPNRNQRSDDLGDAGVRGLNRNRNRSQQEA